MPTQIEPGLYHFDDDDTAPAVRYAVETGSSFIVVSMFGDTASKYIGADGWFAADYVAAFNGLVPECCGEGTAPGQFEPKKGA